MLTVIFLNFFIINKNLDLDSDSYLRKKLFLFYKKVRIRIQTIWIKKLVCIRIFCMMKVMASGIAEAGAAFVVGLPL